MGLMSDLKKAIESDEKNFGKENVPFMHKSDFQIFDYLNGQLDYSKSGKPIFNVGSDAGTSSMVVGKPGSGKSTFAYQYAYSIMKKYDESSLYIMDFENAFKESRFKSITGCDTEYYKEHVTVKSTKIYTETVLKLVMQIAKFKTSPEVEKQLLIENAEGIVDEDGKLTKILPPTFIIVDSLALMRTKDFQEAGKNNDEFNGLTSGGRNAIVNKELMARIIQPCQEANIIVIFINHVNTNMSMGVTPAVSSTRFLSNNKSVSGGSAVQYSVNLFIEIEAKDKLDKDDKYGIKGFKANINIIKSRNASAGISTTMIFNQEEGFDEDLSMFELLYNNKKICGAGVGMYLPGLETKKFRMSTFKERLKDEEFKNVWDVLCKQTLEEFVESNGSSKLFRKMSEDGEVIYNNEEEMPAEDVE